MRLAVMTVLGLFFAFQFACAPKVAPNYEPSIYERICGKELERHGDIDYQPSFKHFGNRAMDEYIREPGPFKELSKQFRTSDGLCRGAFLQLMVTVHSEDFIKNIKKIDPFLTEAERINVLNLIRSEKMQGLLPFVRSNLTHSSSKVRASAVTCVKLFPKEEHEPIFLSALMGETEPKVLEQLILELDLEELSDFRGAIEELRSHPSSVIHEAVLMSLATSDRKDAIELVAMYEDHPMKEIAERATFIKGRLEKNGKMSYKTGPVKVVTREATKKEPEVDPELQEDFIHAVRMDRMDEVAFYLKRGGSWSQRGKFGYSAFEYLLSYGKIETLKASVELGLDHHLSAKNMSPLLFMMGNGHKDLGEKVRYLASLGHDIHEVDKDGENLIFNACYSGKTPAIEVLLELGVDPNVRDNLGRKAIEIARLLEYEKIVALLEK